MLYFSSAEVSNLPEKLGAGMLPGGNLTDFSFINARVIVGAAAAYLTVLTLLKYTVARRRPGLFPTTMDRLGYWWCLTAFIAASIRFGRVPLVAGILVTSFLALKEYFTVIPTRKADRAAMLLSYLSIPFILYHVYIPWYNMFVLTVPVYVFLLLPVVLALQRERAGMVLSLGKIAFGVMFLVYCLGHVGYLFIMDPRWFVSVLLLTELADQSQTCLSRLWGTAPLPMDSETGVRKNWTGVVLSAVVTVLACVVLARFNGWSPVHCIVIGVLISVLAVLGDLVVFSIRQDLGIAGPRAIVPGRGLILDRMRALCYTAPVMFHYLRYFLT